MHAIHQLSAGFTNGDAISNEARVLRALFQSWGYDSRIFSAAGSIAPTLRHEAGDLEAARRIIRPDDVVLLHLSIGSPVNDAFAALPGRKAIRYHNMTPADFFRGLQEPIARDLAWGRRQAQALAGTATVVTAVSRYNAVELEAMGYRAVRMLPLLLDFDAVHAAPDPRVERRLRDDRINVLFVGRCAPNKRIEDVLTAFGYFQQAVEPHSRLLLVGSWAGLEAYQLFLQTYARRLNLREAHFTGSASQAALSAYYRCAHVFLCLSEHEGFCIPLLESMAHDVPVLAYAAAAVPETLDGAGVLVRAKRYEALAEMMGRLAHDTALREAVLRGQRARLARYRARDLAREIKEALQPLL